MPMESTASFRVTPINTTVTPAPPPKHTFQSLHRSLMLPCVSTDPIAPSCEVVMPLVPSSLATDLVITIELAQSDFEAASEYVTSIFVGSEQLGDIFLTEGGFDDICDRKIVIVDRAIVPLSSLEDDGNLRVRIGTSSEVGGYRCADGSTLYAEILVSWITPVVRHAFTHNFFVEAGPAAAAILLVQPKPEEIAARAFSPELVVELHDLAGNRAKDQATFELRVVAQTVQDPNSNHTRAGMESQSMAGSDPSRCSLACDKHEAPQLLGTTRVQVLEGRAIFRNLAPGTAMSRPVALNFTVFSSASGTWFRTRMQVISEPFHVRAGPVASFQIVDQPGHALGGEALFRQPVIALVDGGGNLAVDTSDFAVWAALRNASSEFATLRGNRLVRVKESIATFTDLLVDMAGEGYALEFFLSKASESLGAAHQRPPATDSAVIALSSGFNVGIGKAFRLTTAVFPNVSKCSGARIPASGSDSAANESSTAKQCLLADSTQSRSVLLTVQVRKEGVRGEGRVGTDPDGGPCLPEP